jgi:hypothetical protein
MNNTGRLCFNFLRSEGYLPQINQVDDIIFKAEGNTFIVMIDENDEQFLNLILPNFYELNGNLEMNKALRVANIVNQKVKVGKIIISNNIHVWAIAEQFIDSTPDLEDFFRRTINAVLKAAEDFRSLMA